MNASQMLSDVEHLELVLSGKAKALSDEKAIVEGLRRKLRNAEARNETLSKEVKMCNRIILELKETLTKSKNNREHLVEKLKKKAGDQQ
eukprot:CAMPEP_0170185772 /NCGR_PEP_ID=MMETSP0040_2-20121228/37411_1 /TAXON_ID=641309 /ORGANISM="Lotharella oceanica, Strain CCMP622" /LENGTH=88 /DNA_ID=CAMNT_0010432281 /DNA_START=20 /DNA_END=286 /DNA_ORIENTATION=+